MLPALESPLSFSLPSTTVPSRPSIWCSMLTWSKHMYQHILSRIVAGLGEESGYQYLWSFEPFVRTDEPPDSDHGHWTSVDENRPIHARRARLVRLSAARRVDEGFATTHSKSEPVTLGSIKIGTMRATNAQAALPMYMLNGPRFQGPALNRLPTKKTRMKMGIVKATKAATAAMENSAPAARSPPKTRRTMSIPSTVLNQTALTGVLVCLLTRLIHQEQGKQSSRA